MVGSITMDKQTEPVVDLGFTLKLRGSFAIWTNPIFFFENRNMYYYFEIDKIFHKNLLFGIESENLFTFNPNNDLGVGLHGKLIVGSMILIPAYQWHNEGQNQFWIRTILNF